MADTSGSEAREVGTTKSKILQFIRPSAPAPNFETAALRAEIDGLRLALSLTQEALREERSDKEHWRDEAKQLRQLLAATKPERSTIVQEPGNVPPEPAAEPKAIAAPPLVPAAEAEPDQLATGMSPVQSAGPDPRSRWWGRLFA
jgi:hypothetical protein